MKKMAILLAFSLAPFGAAGTSLAQEKIAGKTKWPECFCTDRYGKRRELGDIICLTVGDRSYEAKCIMVQNNPYWRDLNRGCLSSSLPPEKNKNMTVRPREFATLYQ